MRPIPNSFLYSILLMFAGLLWSFLIRTPVISALVLILAASLYFTGTFSFKQSPLPQVSTPVPASVDQAASALAEQVAAACPQPEKTLTKIVIIPIEGDREQTVEKNLYKVLERNTVNGWYQPVERSVIIQALEKVHYTFGSQDYPAALINMTGAEFVLSGKLTEFAPKGNSHVIAGSFSLVDLTKQKEVFSLRFTTVPQQKSTVRSAGGTVLRWISVFIFTLVYPILMIPVIQRILAKDNSGTNLAGMLGLALIPVGVAVLLTGILPTGAFSVIGYLLLFALSAAWVGFVMDKVAAR
jgi:hypothetical protein